MRWRLARHLELIVMPCFKLFSLSGDYFLDYLYTMYIIDTSKQETNRRKKMKSTTFKSHGKKVTIKKGDKLLELSSYKILVVTNPGDKNDQNVHLSDGMIIPWTFFGGEYEPQKTKNRSLVMKRAHQLVKTLGLTFSDSLKIAWGCSNSCLAGYAR